MTTQSASESRPAPDPAVSTTRRRVGRPLRVTLPSGVTVLARRPSLQSIVALGDIPTDLADVVSAMLQRGRMKLEEMNPAQLKNAMQFAEFYLSYVLVEPKVTSGPSTVTEDADGTLHGAINLLDLPDEDKNLLYAFGHGLIVMDEEKGVTVSSGLATFRAGTERDSVGSVGESVPREAVHLDGHSAG